MSCAADVLGDRAWRVVTGDCREVLAGLPAGSVDHTIADPPYNQATHAGARHDVTTPLGIDFAPLEDLAFLPEILRVTRRWDLAFCALEQLGLYEGAAADAWIRSGFWHKPDAMPQLTGDRPAQPGEGLAIMHREGRKRWNGGGLPAFWSFPIERKDRVHPTQKPIALMMRIVEQFTDPGDLVFDPFCGSGTTGVACLRLGRRFLGVEIDPKYADLARERLAAEGDGVSLVAARAKQVGMFGGGG